MGFPGKSCPGLTIRLGQVVVEFRFSSLVGFADFFGAALESEAVVYARERLMTLESSMLITPLSPAFVAGKRADDGSNLDGNS